MTDIKNNDANTIFPIFPGIDLHFINTESREYVFRSGCTGKCLNIIYCSEGQAENDTNGELLHFSSGDVAVNTAGGGTAFYLPLGFFSGIACSVDLISAPDDLSRILDDVNVSTSTCAERLSPDGRMLVLHQNPLIQHIFSELAHVPETIRRGYFKVKILELLLLLSDMDPVTPRPAREKPAAGQLKLARDICHYMGTHLDCHTTIDELSEIFHTSPTQIKNSFKAVYGETVYQFSRKQKMRAAARILRTSDSTVLEIAGQFGYDNGSKFANAFRDVYGMTPNEYRSARAENS